VLIGQFGVGFYSSFTVADRVTLETRRADAPEDGAVRWESDGTGSYTLENCSRTEPGTEVILHLKEDAGEFLEAYRLRHIITRYSDHVAFPIRMPKLDDDGKTTDEWETVNRASALWTRAKSDISDEEYREFYKHVAHDFEDPSAWVHSHVEGKQQYTTLFYIPKRAPFDLWDRDRRHGVKLYVKRVFIMDDAEKMLPTYLRFVRGVVDSSDLPLNVSREILQNNRLVDGIRSGSVKKILGLLESIAENEPEKYAEIWKNFGRVLKEGPGEDYANREQIAKLLRFASTHNADDNQNVSLAEYKARMKEGQKAIYVRDRRQPCGGAQQPPPRDLPQARDRGAAAVRPGRRVAAVTPRQLRRYADQVGGQGRSRSRRGDRQGGRRRRGREGGKGELGDLPERIQAALGDRVDGVRPSRRLVESPSCIVLGEHEMALYLQELMKQAGQPTFGSKPVLEVNPAHPLVQRLKGSDGVEFDDLATLLFEQALLTEGGQLEDPAGFVAR
jgi:molecular chaperone HtpG